MTALGSRFILATLCLLVGGFLFVLRITAFRRKSGGVFKPVVEVAVNNAAQGLPIDAQVVARGRADVCVAGQVTDEGYVRAGVQEIHAAGVAKQMRRKRLLDRSSLAQLGEVA